jgi:hypothetical protein
MPEAHKSEKAKVLLMDHTSSYWVHIQTAEQLAKLMSECGNFDVAKLYRAGAMSDGYSNEPEGLVALRSREGRLLIASSYIAGDLQWPTSPDGRSPAMIREVFKKEIDILKSRADELFPVDQVEPKNGR